MSKEAEAKGQMWRQHNPIHFVSIENEANSHNYYEIGLGFFCVDSCIFLVYLFPSLLFNANHSLSAQHDLLTRCLKGKSKSLSHYARDKIYFR